MASIAGIKAGVKTVNKAFSKPIKKRVIETVLASKKAGGLLWNVKQANQLRPYITGRKSLEFIQNTEDQARTFKKKIISMAELKQADIEQMGKLHAMVASKLNALYYANSEIFDYYFDYEEFIDTPMGMMTTKQSFDEINTLIETYERVYGTV